jgi:hypothetical protein
MVNEEPCARKKSVALAQIVAATGEPSYCLVPGSVAEMVPETPTRAGWSAGHDVPGAGAPLAMLVSWKLTPFRNGAFQKIVSVPGTVRWVKPVPGSSPRAMQPVSGWGAPERRHDSSHRNP